MTDERRPKGVPNVRRQQLEARRAGRPTGRITMMTDRPPPPQIRALVAEEPLPWTDAELDRGERGDT